MYQKTVFRQICANIASIGPVRARRRVASYLKALYSPELEGRIWFYEQDGNGFPTRRIDTIVTGIGRFEPTMLTQNILDISAWRNIDRPENFEGGYWQPLSRGDLLGCKTMNELCAECDRNDRHNDNNRDDYYLSWVDRMFRLWFERIDIRITKHMGYGLFARKRLQANIFIGEYTGILVPIDETLPDEMAEYHFGISIGKKVTDPDASQPMCWVDGTQKGSIFRFMAHSCGPNAEVVDARVGTHHRVLAVRTIRDIEVNEAITIDYGMEWFTGKQRCLCGTDDCRNRPQAGDSDIVD